MISTFLYNLHIFFSDFSKHTLAKKVVFAPGTAPMKKGNSEVLEILFATDFDSAYFVDPVYGVGGEDSPLRWDFQEIQKLDASCVVTNTHMGVSVLFRYRQKDRVITFVAGDATLSEFQPEMFTIFFSGKRIGMYPGFGLRGTPSDYLPGILNHLSLGGYVVPDRDLLDDRIYFLIPSKELGLEEIQGIRVPITRKDFPKGYSEGKRFVHGDTAPGVGLYKKIA